jgi:predicted AlkP superfamily phosphohydrolase/phosphomutase
MVKDEVLLNKDEFVVKSDYGLHEILFAHMINKWDMDILEVGFDTGGLVMRDGLFFEDDGLAVGYLAGVHYKIIRRDNESQTDRGSDDGVNRSGEGLDSEVEREVAQVEEGAVDTAGDS